MFAILPRLIRVLALYAVLAAFLVLLFRLLSDLIGLLCGLECILIAALFALHLIASAIGPMLWNKEQEKRTK